MKICRWGRTRLHSSTGILSTIEYSEFQKKVGFSDIFPVGMIYLKMSLCGYMTPMSLFYKCNYHAFVKTRVSQLLSGPDSGCFLSQRMFALFRNSMYAENVDHADPQTKFFTQLNLISTNKTFANSSPVNILIWIFHPLPTRSGNG